MATGYTHALEEMNYDVPRWIKEKMIRAMGVCVMLRDNGDLSEQDLKKALARPAYSKSYHGEAIASTKKELKRFEERTDLQWEAAYKKSFKEEQKRYDTRITEYTEKKQKHEASLATVKKWFEKAQAENQSETVINTLKYSLEQLNQAYDWDYRNPPSRPSVLDLDWKGWRDEQVEATNRSLAYHEKELVKEEERKSQFNPIEEYDRLISFVDAQTGN